LLRVDRAIVDLYCGTVQRVPKQITLDIDDTFDAAYNALQLRQLIVCYDEYGF
jgi:hypothetical protein